MNITKVNEKLNYDKYFDPNFNWNDWRFYKNNVNLFTDEFWQIFKHKINLLLLLKYKHHIK